MANQLENIAGLQSILETVNSLPNAGSGGGGGTPETCTVNLPGSILRLLAYMKLNDNGEEVICSVRNSTELYNTTSVQAVKNSILVMVPNYTMLNANITSGLTLLYYNSNLLVIGINNDSNEPQTITVVTD